MLLCPRCTLKLVSLEAAVALANKRAETAKEEAANIKRFTDVVDDEKVPAHGSVGMADRPWG